MKTRLTDLLDIEFPILQGAMAWISESQLASAVSNAGGAGIIATGGRDVQWLEDEIRKTRELTNKPFGVNIVVLDSTNDKMVDLVCKEKVDFVTFGAGNPVPYIKRLKEYGIKVLPVVPNLKLAKRVEEAGADAVILEGMEAGGHIGHLTTMAHMTNVIPNISIPVIVAGGIADGRGIAAALLMGAEGVQIGSRFLLAKECQVHINFKNRIIEAQDTESIVTGYTTGHGVRGLRNTFSDEYIIKEFSGAPADVLHKIAMGTYRKAVVEGDTENGFVIAGQSVVPLNRVQSSKEIIDELVQETKDILQNAMKFL